MVFRLAKCVMQYQPLGVRGEWDGSELRALAALADDPGFPAGAHNWVFNPVPGDSVFAADLLRLQAGTLCTHTCKIKFRRWEERSLRSVLL